MDDTRFLAEVVSMARIYVRHGRFDLARRLLRDFILMEENLAQPRPYALAMAYYNLGEVYSDHGNYLIASDLQHQAAQHWESRNPDKSVDLLWYANTLTQLEHETDRLIREYQREREIGIA
ncbi:MAG: hypothetical protein K2X77_15640 [Candidatus Obscuribacterales bacterium]|jgi:tetratricopeptide (TPR) repeat protein|nr:hypothetical protein [Candidatus Obscuribacterales bacterium]